MKNPAVKKILRDEKTRKVHPDRELAALLVMAVQAGKVPANDPAPKDESAAA